jgi:preprotein translocase subunit SecF
MRRHHPSNSASTAIILLAMVLAILMFGGWAWAMFAVIGILVGAYKIGW